jgi:cytochrome c oxidase subunit 3
MAHAPTSTASEKYYVPHGSPWPIVGSIALFTSVGGGAMWLNHVEAGPWVMTAGLGLLVFMFVGWFGTVIRESEGRLYNEAVDRSFRMGMMWFIFSEVMFFAGFFGALLYARQFSVPWLGGEGTKLLTKVIRGDEYEAAWPTNGPILLLWGATITVAHHAIRAGNRRLLNIFLALTFLLGFLFIYLQVTEYIEAYTHHNLKLTSGIYGSTFFPLTAFHGFHVTIGALMLVVIWFRCLKGHFTPTHHFAFEGVAWYWHFVDVVWLGLFIFVYWL